MPSVYRKVKNKLNGKEGYISLNYFINNGLGIMEFAEKEWIKFVPRNAEVIR